MNKKWAATETRLVEPYPRADQALRDVRFRVDPVGEYSEAPAYWLDPDDLPENFAPEFSLRVDADGIQRGARIAPEETRLVCVVRDRMLRKWKSIQEWPVLEIQDRYAIHMSTLSEFGVPWRLEFAILLTPLRELRRVPGLAYLPQHVLGEKSFRVGLQRDGARFPVEIRETAWFEQVGLPRDTVWTIDWVSEDVNVSPAEALRVVVNEVYREPVEKMLASKQAPAVLAHQMAADIFAEVAYVVLREAESVDVDPDSLAGVVLDALGIRDESTYRRFRITGEPRLEVLSDLRAHAQSVIGLSHILERV